MSLTTGVRFPALETASLSNQRLSHFFLCKLNVHGSGQTQINSETLCQEMLLQILSRGHYKIKIICVQEVMTI